MGISQLIDMNNARGEKHRCATISEETAQAILDAKGTATQRVLAEKYGATMGIVNSIHRRVSWKHLRRSS